MKIVGLILAIVGFILIFICLYLIITTYLIYKRRFKYEKMSDDELHEYYEKACNIGEEKMKKIISEKLEKVLGRKLR